jgi:hypothetical protein
MKKIVFSSLLLISYAANAQPKIGIGVISPQTQLDVSKSMRMGGVTAGSSFLSYDSVTGNFTWNRSSIFAPANQPLIKHSAGQEGLYYSNGAIEYKNGTGILQFRTDWPTGDAYIGHNLGIGRANPESPLHFASEYGEKIIFYGGAVANYGIGVQPHLLQIHTDQYASTIELGYGSNSNFTELMRINGNGRVGIGTTDPQASLDVVKGSNLATAAFFPTDVNAGLNSHFNYGSSENTYIRGGKVILNDVENGKIGIGIEPTYADALLEVNGRIRMRKLASASMAGYYLNRSDNLAVAGLVGMVGQNIGFFGNSSSTFQMNMTSGDLRFGPGSGNAGQVLRSKGTSLPPVWASATNQLYNSTVVSSSSALQMYAGEVPKDITGASETFTLAGNATIIVSYNIEIRMDADLEGYAAAFVDLLFDNNLITRSGTYTEYHMQTITGTSVIQATAGSHTIKLQGSCTDRDLVFNSHGSAQSLFIRILNK